MKNHAACVQSGFALFNFYSPQRLRVQSLAAMVCLALVFPSVSWAFVAPQPASAPNLMLNRQTIEIPRHIGQITQIVPGDDRLVVHVQDLHCNYEVQKNIASLIHLLAQKTKIRLVAVEGAALPINAMQLRTFPIHEISEEVSDYFVRQGKLSGAEFYAATGENPIRLEGVEDAELYAANKLSVTTLLTSETQGLCADLRAALNALKPDLYTPGLRAFDARCRDFSEGKASLPTQAKFLRQTAQGLHVSWQDYPLLFRYLTNRRAIMPVELDAEILLGEMEGLETQLRKRFYTSPAQAELDQQLRRLAIIEKMLNISATAEELETFAAERSRYRTQSFMDLIHRFRPNDAFDSEWYHLDSLLQTAERFYTVADQRSRRLAENTVAKLASRGEKAAILITGGFHTQGVVNALKTSGVSVVSVKPRITRQDRINPYFTLLQNRKTPLEKLLSQNQNWLTLESFLPKRDNPEQVLAETALADSRERLFFRGVDLYLKMKTVVHFFKQGNTGMRLKQQVANLVGRIRSVASIRVFPEHLRNHHSSVSFPVQIGETPLLAVAWGTDQSAPIPQERLTEYAPMARGAIGLVGPEQTAAVEKALDQSQRGWDLLQDKTRAGWSAIHALSSIGWDKLWRAGHSLKTWVARLQYSNNHSFLLTVAGLVVWAVLAYLHSLDANAAREYAVWGIALGGAKVKPGRQADHTTQQGKSKMKARPSVQADALRETVLAQLEAGLDPADWKALAKALARADTDTVRETGLLRKILGILGVDRIPALESLVKQQDVISLENIHRRMDRLLLVYRLGNQYDQYLNLDLIVSVLASGDDWQDKRVLLEEYFATGSAKLLNAILRSPKKPAEIQAMIELLRAARFSNTAISEALVRVEAIESITNYYALIKPFPNFDRAVLLRFWEGKGTLDDLVYFFEFYSEKRQTVSLDAIAYLVRQCLSSPTRFAIAEMLQPAHRLTPEQLADLPHAAYLRRLNQCRPEFIERLRAVFSATSERLANAREPGDLAKKKAAPANQPKAVFVPHAGGWIHSSELGAQVNEGHYQSLKSAGRVLVKNVSSDPIHGKIIWAEEIWDQHPELRGRNDLTLELDAGQVIRAWAGDPYPIDLAGERDRGVSLAWIKNADYLLAQEKPFRELLVADHDPYEMARVVCSPEYRADPAGPDEPNQVYIKHGSRWVYKGCWGQNPFLSNYAALLPMAESLLVKHVPTGGPESVLQCGTVRCWEKYPEISLRTDITLEFASGDLVRAWAGDPYPENDSARRDRTISLVLVKNYDYFMDQDVPYLSMKLAYYDEPELARVILDPRYTRVPQRRDEPNMLYVLTGTHWRYKLTLNKKIFSRHVEAFVHPNPAALVKNVRVNRDTGAMKWGKKKYWGDHPAIKGRTDITLEFASGDLVRAWAGDPYPEDDLQKRDRRISLVWVRSNDYHLDHDGPDLLFKPDVKTGRAPGGHLQSSVWRILAGIMLSGGTGYFLNSIGSAPYAGWSLAMVGVLAGSVLSGIRMAYRVLVFRVFNWTELTPSRLAQQQAAFLEIWGAILTKARVEKNGESPVQLGWLVSGQTVDWDELMLRPDLWPVGLAQPSLWHRLTGSVSLGRGEPGHVWIHPRVLFFPRWAQRAILQHELREAQGWGHGLATVSEHAAAVKEGLSAVRRWLLSGSARGGTDFPEDVINQSLTQGKPTLFKILDLYRRVLPSDGRWLRFGAHWEPLLAGIAGWLGLVGALFTPRAEDRANPARPLTMREKQIVLADALDARQRDTQWMRIRKQNATAPLRKKVMLALRLGDFTALPEGHIVVELPAAWEEAPQANAFLKGMVALSLWRQSRRYQAAVERANQDLGQWLHDQGRDQAPSAGASPGRAALIQWLNHPTRANAQKWLDAVLQNLSFEGQTVRQLPAGFDRDQRQAALIRSVMEFNAWIRRLPDCRALPVWIEEGRLPNGETEVWIPRLGPAHWRGRYRDLLQDLGIIVKPDGKAWPQKEPRRLFHGAV